MTLTPAGERVLSAASELFYARGIRAVGVDLIAEAAGTTKKTLYDRFGSKDALVAAYLERRMRRWQEFVLDHLARHTREPGVDRVLGVLDALAAWMAAHDRGCAFVNAYAEVGGTDHPGLRVIRAEKRWVRDLYVRLCDEADVVDAEWTAGALHVVHEGAIVAATAGGQDDAMVLARAVGECILAAR